MQHTSYLYYAHTCACVSACVCVCGCVLTVCIVFLDVYHVDVQEVQRYNYPSQIDELNLLIKYPNHMHGTHTLTHTHTHNPE